MQPSLTDGRREMSYNILTDRLPDYVTLDGRKYGIRTDFRRWILMLELFDECREKSTARIDALTAALSSMPLVMKNPDECSSLPAEEKIRLLGELARFAAFGVKEDKRSDGRETDVEQAFDFYADAGLILSSFLSEYGIDLTKESMHWWKFLTLLRSLPSESDFMRVVRLRLCDTTKIADDNARRQMRRAKAAVRIRKPQ